MVAYSARAATAELSSACLCTRFAAATLRCAATAAVACATRASWVTVRARASRSLASRTVCLSISESTVFSWLVTDAGSWELRMTTSPISAGSPLA